MYSHSSDSCQHSFSQFPYAMCASFHAQCVGVLHDASSGVAWSADAEFGQKRAVKQLYAQLLQDIGLCARKRGHSRSTPSA